MNKKDFLKGKALTSARRMVGFFRRVDPYECGLQHGELVLGEDVFRLGHLRVGNDPLVGEHAAVFLDRKNARRVKIKDLLGVGDNVLLVEELDIRRGQFVAGQDPGARQDRENPSGLQWGGLSRPGQMKP